MSASSSENLIFLKRIKLINRKNFQEKNELLCEPQSEEVTILWSKIPWNVQQIAKTDHAHNQLNSFEIFLTTSDFFVDKFHHTSSIRFENVQFFDKNAIY